MVFNWPFLGISKFKQLVPLIVASNGCLFGKLGPFIMDKTRKLGVIAVLNLILVPQSEDNGIAK